MSLLFIQYWDVIEGREDEYAGFINNTYLPAIGTLGFVPVGGYYVEIGFGPRSIAVFSAESLDEISRIITGRDFRDLALKLRKYVTNFNSTVLEPQGTVKAGKYPVQKSVWKFNQYYNLKPEVKEAYESFFTDEYLPEMEKIPYLTVTNCWNVVLGGFCDIILEFTFKDPEDIGRLVKNIEFQKITTRLKKKFITNYTNRIQKSTQWFREPQWFTH
ncbi:MAG TPA: hypothetical protein PLR60_01075 [Syntrophorhabdaceae bacterium]|nr:hypothetical protein [Syntrophorhabdaceae bacterium]